MPMRYRDYASSPGPIMPPWTVLHGLLGEAQGCGRTRPSMLPGTLGCSVQGRSMLVVGHKNNPRTRSTKAQAHRSCEREKDKDRERSEACVKGVPRPPFPYR
jgi:hypothetical protein